MAGRKLKSQISISLVATFILISIIFGSLVYLLEKQRYEDRSRTIEHSLDVLIGQKIGSIGHQMFFKNMEGLEFEMGLFMKFEGILGGQFFDAEGKTIYSTHESLLPLPAHRLLAIKSGYQLEHVDAFDRNCLSYTAPVVVVGDHYGYVRVLYDFERPYRQAQLEGLVFFSLIITLFSCSVFLVSRMLRRLVTDPLQLLSGAMQRVARGEAGVQVKIDSPNEIGMIAGVFNDMSRENSDMQETLKEINYSLEQQIVIKSEELDHSQSLLASVLDSSQDGIMVLRSIHDKQGGIEDYEWLMANPTAATNFATEIGAIVGRQFFSRKPSFANDELFADLCQVSESGKPLDKEIYCEFEKKRGWFQVMAVPIRAGLAVTFRDITERKLLEMDLKRLAEKDGLTDLANRGYFDSYFNDEWQACRDEKRILAVIFIDVDHFKTYNDTYGHLAGDDCLKKIAGILKKYASRPRDLAARYGGEEFVLLLPGVDRAGTGELVAEIFEEITNLAITNRGSTTADIVTVSLGVALTVPAEGLSSQDFLQAADQALYTSKNEGRNRSTVVSYPEGSFPG